jgi:hypothetical protein
MLPWQFGGFATNFLQLGLFGPNNPDFLDCLAKDPPSILPPTWRQISFHYLSFAMDFRVLAGWVNSTEQFRNSQNTSINTNLLAGGDQSRPESQMWWMKDSQTPHKCLAQETWRCAAHHIRGVLFVLWWRLRVFELKFKSGQ